MQNKKIVFFKKLNSIGGPTSFQKKFIFWLKKKNFTYEFLNKSNMFSKKILFINSGTFNILYLFISLMINTKLVQRLNGFYDLKKNNKNLIKCFLINLSMKFIRRYLANYIIYQSFSSKILWDKYFGFVDKNFSIIHNSSFKKSVESSFNPSQKFYDICISEGNIENNYYNKKIFDLINNISFTMKQIRHVYIFGNINLDFKKSFKFNKKLKFMNKVDHAYLIKFYKKKNLIFFGIEFNPSCSNSIIEASAFGIPTLTLNTGSYKELMLRSGYQIDFKEITDKNLKAKVRMSLMRIIKNYKTLSMRSLRNSKRFLPENIFKQYYEIFQKL